MNRLIEKVRDLDYGVKREIDERWEEFIRMRSAGEDEWFSELCFCILTANTSAEMGMRVQKKVGHDGFAKTEAGKLGQELKNAGCRFYNKKAEYIADARKFDGKLKGIIKAFKNEFKAREWLVENVKGVGYKEASHFLRNVGYGDVSILDRHILSLLREYDLIGDFSNINKKRYIAIEHVLRDVGNSLHMPLGKLDLCLWYLKTGKVLK